MLSLFSVENPFIMLLRELFLEIFWDLADWCIPIRGRSIVGV